MFKTEEISLSIWLAIYSLEREDCAADVYSLWLLKSVSLECEVFKTASRKNIGTHLRDEGLENWIIKYIEDRNAGSFSSRLDWDIFSEHVA